jgi:hypothetical protein
MWHPLYGPWACQTQKPLPQSVTIVAAYVQASVNQQTKKVLIDFPRSPLNHWQMYEYSATAALTPTALFMAILICTDAILQYVLAIFYGTTYGDVIMQNHALVISEIMLKLYRKSGQR